MTRRVRGTFVPDNGGTLPLSARRTALAALLAVLIPLVVSGAPPREEYDRQLEAQLAMLKPESLPIWKQANAARERGEHAEASRLYAAVASFAPTFDAATRRQAGEELALEHRRNAVSLARAAVAAQASPENLASLAYCLSSGSKTENPSDADAREALVLARRAATLAPDDPWMQVLLCQAALRGDNLPALKDGVGRLLVVAPEEVSTHQFAALLAATEGRYADARSALDRARALGLSEERYKALSSAIEGSRSPASRWLPRVGWTLGIWVGSLLVLLGLGALLSRSVLAEAETMSRDSRRDPSRQGALLRRAYAVVLWLSCAYYYISLPIVAFLVLLLGGGIVYAMLAIGRIPIKLLALVVIVTLVTLWSILKSLFIRGQDDDPGDLFDLRREPRVRSLLGEVASRIGTRPVDNVYLTPGTDFAVMERGGLGRQLRGGSERCLILGVGVLEGLKIGAFKAILAHEYGHFVNRDTAGGGFALAVRRSLIAMAHALAAGGAADWYNPAWLFVNGFYRVFLRISHGASRLQEILADRWAALAYGSKAFEEGLRHVIEQSVRFDARASFTVREMAAQRNAVANLYTHQSATALPEEEVARAIRAALNRTPSPFDSHPSPFERSRWVRALGVGGTPSPNDAEEVWTLFDNREQIERRMTEVVQLALHR
jgi:Zn-dependent protease with chaperone function